MHPSRAAPLLNRRTASILFLFVLLQSFAAVFAAEDTLAAFDLPAGNAAETLKQFAEQAKREIMFPAETVLGVRTNAIQGKFSPRVALNQMLAETGLAVVEDAKTGAMMVYCATPSAHTGSESQSLPENPKKTMKRKTSISLVMSWLALTLAPDLAAQTAEGNAVSARTLAKYDLNKNGKLDPDELAAMQADNARAANVPVASATAAASDEAVMLSPFEVREANNGYYASNTMSGTRLNTKLGDLASSISVVTKQQMSDFAMLDINDIFNYEASTEGTGNFTDFTVDRNGMVADNILSNPQGANRIRGMGAANIALNNFATSGRVPIDPINIDSVEISRGPNSNIFGLGQGSGTVNLIASTANLSKDTSTVEARVDDLGGYRSSLDLNRTIIKGKLAARGSMVYQHDAYLQKPSGTTTKRLNFMLRYQPFKNTSLRASFQSYELNGTRASTITPRDAISYWKNLGSPSWDPVTSTVTVNGVSTATGTVNPAGFGPATFTDPVLFVDQNGIQLWEIQRAPVATATNGPNNTAGTARLQESQPLPIRTGHPLYSTVAGISDRSLFDYSDINLAGPNNIFDHNDTTTIELEQFLINTDRQKLAVQAGWNREDADRLTRNLVGGISSTGASNYIYVDVNSRLLDGRANPFFGRPYLGVGEPRHFSQPYLRDTFRGQAAYLLDFTDSQSRLRWLGRLNLVGYIEQRLTKSYQYSFRDANIVDNPVYAPAGQPKANQGGVTSPISTRGYYHFYVGDNNGQNVDYAPSNFKDGNYPFNWFNPLANQWVADPATLAEAAIQEGTAGSAASQTLLKTRGGMLQSTLLQDRIVFTFGKRHDSNSSRYQKASVLMPNGYQFDYAAMDGWVGDWATKTGDTTTKGVVARPFKGWPMIDRHLNEGGAAGFVANLLSGMNVYYNKSDSFAPEISAIAITGELLPNPTSNGKDYGFSVNLWGDKLVLRANRYETAQINSRTGIFGTFAQRTLRVDFANYAGNSDAFSLQTQARLWVAAANPGFSSDQVETAVFKIMGMTPEQAAVFVNAGNAGTAAISETQDMVGKGDEIELNFNPDRYWTLKLNVTRSESIDSKIAPHIPGWIVQRMSLWTSIIDPRSNTPWFTTGYPTTTSGTAATFLQNNVVAPIALGQATDGKSRPEIREWRVNSSASLRLARFTEQRWLKNMTVGGSLRWESTGAIGYYGIPVNGDIAAAIQLDPNRPIYDKAHIYADGFASYNTRFFGDRVRARFQLNVKNIQESRAHLQAVGAYPDGTPHTFRIINPRTFIFTTTFDL
jgi:hypothetical protein